MDFLQRECHTEVWQLARYEICSVWPDFQLNAGRKEGRIVRKTDSKAVGSQSHSHWCVFSLSLSFAVMSLIIICPVTHSLWNNVTAAVKHVYWELDRKRLAMHKASSRVSHSQISSQLKVILPSQSSYFCFEEPGGISEGSEARMSSIPGSSGILHRSSGLWLDRSDCSQHHEFQIILFHLICFLIHHLVYIYLYVHCASEQQKICLFLMWSFFSITFFAHSWNWK